MALRSLNNLSQLNNLISSHFNLTELKKLCTDLGIEYEDLAGDTRSEKVLELTAKMRRNGRLPGLYSHLQAQRPGVEWPELANSLTPVLSSPNKGETEVDIEWTGRLLTYHKNYLKTRHSRKYGSELLRISEGADHFVNVTTQICNQSATECSLTPLVEALEHPDIQIRKFAVKVLGETGSLSAIDHSLIVPALIKLIQSEKEVVVKRQAVWALGALRPMAHKESVRKVLVALLIDAVEDTAVRWRAAWALGEIKEGSSILGHIAARQDVDENIRYAAIRSLGFIGAFRSVRTLKLVVSQDNAKLQKIAQWSLEEIQQQKK